MRRLTLSLVAALSLVACGTSDDARVRIDLTSLWQEAGQTLGEIWVRAYDDTGALTTEASMTDLSATVDLEVGVGPARRFEVEALLADVWVPTPSYWGERTVDLQPYDEIELVVPVFPAGGLLGTVTVSDGTPIPDGTPVVATAVAPRVDAPAARDFTIVGGTYSGTLPDGRYTLSVSFTDDAGGNRSGQTAVSIVHAEVITASELVVGP